jgi:outer membrane protein insertion porin family
MIQDAGFLKTLNSVTQPRKCATGISRFFRIAMVMVTAGNQCWVTPGRAEPEAATGTQDGTTQRADREGSRVKVKKIELIGNKAFKSSTLKKLLKTKRKKWFAFPSDYSEQTVREDAEKLREFYYNSGYLGFKVEIEAQFTSDRSKALVTFRMDEGRPYTIKAIAFGGNEYFPEEELRTHLEIAEGQVYCKDKADRDAKLIEEHYREKGYIDAYVEQGLRFAPNVNDNSIVVYFTTYEGRQFRIGRIEISGNEQVQDKVARRVLDEYDFTPGQLYNAQIAPKQGNGLMEMYVQRSTRADEVIIRPVAPEDGSPQRKDVRVHVTEGMTGMFIPGVGVSSDGGVMGRFIFQQQNFDISDQPETWKDLLFMKAFRGAGQSMNIALEPGTHFSRYSATFSDPYFGDKPIDFSLTGMSYERWYESHDEQKLGLSMGFEHRKWGNWRKTLNVRTQDVKVKNLDYDAPQEIRDVKGDNTITGLKLGTGKSRLDNIYLPTQGYRFRIAYEQVVGDHTFGIATASGVKYFPLYEDVLERRTVLAVQIKGGQIVGDAPPFERFYAGGMGRYAIRGFDYRGVSARGLQAGPGIANPKYKDPIGNDWIFTAGTEVTIPLAGNNLAGLVFADSGLIDTGGVRFSMGAGIQILIPRLTSQIPMRFEYGVPLSKDDQDDVRQFNFSMGMMLR